MGCFYGFLVGGLWLGSIGSLQWVIGDLSILKSQNNWDLIRRLLGIFLGGLLFISRFDLILLCIN